jgi:hypothetical protein
LRAAHEATIVWGAVSKVNCVVRNFSAKGARLELPSSTSVPDRFDLIVDRDEDVLPCRVKWRDDGARTIGVEFERRHGKRPVAAAASEA